jgi:nucleotide-binding universal stress UspA family protein
MRAPSTLLLAHHGTAGARRAETLAFELGVPGVTAIVHALVVPEFWAGMQGDDWLNNASTRDVFARYLEGRLAEENAAQVEALEQRCRESGFAYRPLLRLGDPARCVVDLAREERAELVVIGPPRPRGEPGYRSRMDLETLARELPCPLLIAR